MATRYQSEPYLRNATGTVVSAFEEDDGRFCVAISDTIFYPQGGGQKGDRGIIRCAGREYVVVDTVKDTMSTDGRPLCVLQEAAPELKAGEQVEMELDWAHRFAQMRLHSIVHLHHCMMEEVAGHTLPVPRTSDLQDNGTALNRYETEEIDESLVNKAHEKMLAVVASGAAIITRDDPEKIGYRYWESLGFTIPCGGTHLSDVSEIGNFAISYSKKKGNPRVSFELL